jgi:hypothetical protein
VFAETSEHTVLMRRHLIRLKRTVTNTVKIERDCPQTLRSRVWPEGFSSLIRERSHPVLFLIFLLVYTDVMHYPCEYKPGFNSSKPKMGERSRWT